jgi:predicted methyltransferase
MKQLVTLVLLGLVMVVTTTGTADAQATVKPHVQEAVDNPQRAEADRQRDAGRKPGEVLSFVGLMPGMTVLDVFSGGGYYSEILSHLLGSGGQVIAHYNDAYQVFSGTEFEARYANNRLTNVWTYKSEANDIDLKKGSVDLAIFILGFHDIYYKPDFNPLPSIDAKLFMENIYQALAVGGTFVVLDHVAAAGSPTESGNTLHRIDPQIVKSILDAVGFEFLGSSEVLSNTDDDHLLPVFDETIRGKTDRFILKFRKPMGAKE